MKRENPIIVIAIILGAFIFLRANFAEMKHAVPNAKIGNFQLSTQGLGQFGTFPHKETEAGEINYYAQFSLWAGTVTDRGEIRVTSGDQTEKDAPPEWTPLPLTWKEGVKNTISEIKMENTGQFTDTRTFGEGHTPLGLVVRMDSYSLSDTGFALFHYAVELKEGCDPLKGFYIGFQANIDVPDPEGRLTPDNDKIEFLSNGKGIFIWEGKEEKEKSQLLGITLVSTNKPILTWWTNDNDPKNDVERYELLQGKMESQKNLEEADYRFMVSDGPYELNPGEVIHFTVAVVQAEGEKEFKTQVQAADLLFNNRLKSHLLATSPAPEAKKVTTTSYTPESFTLHPCFPNPFNSETRIILDLPESQEVNIALFNVLGQPVKTLFNGNQEAGTQIFTWNGTNSSGQPVVSGVYVLIVKAGDRKFQQKLVLMK